MITNPPVNKDASNENILEQTPNNFTVYYNGKYYSSFASRVGAETFLEGLKKRDEVITK